jgi:ABC-type multidrug transport system fused ATPase/permease subunit
VLVFDSGELVADGSPAELKASNQVYKDLIG